MKRFWIIAAIITVIYCCRGFLGSPAYKINEPTKIPTIILSESLSRNDISPKIELEDEVLICIAYTESFHRKPYTCYGQWLIGYGQARINGQLVHDGMTIDELTAQKEARKHLRKHVFPAINKYVKRPLTRGEFICCSLLAYNMGTKGFKKCDFLKALNEGDPQEECIKNLKGRGGVAKRRWVDAALFTGAITPYDLVQLSAGGCYNFSTDDLYNDSGVVDLSPKKVDDFLTSDLNQIGKKVIDII